MRQKAEHHLKYLQDRVDRRAASTLHIPGMMGSPAPVPSIRLGSNGVGRGDGSGANGMDEDEDAAGEDEDGDVDMDGDGLQPPNGQGESTGTAS